MWRNWRNCCEWSYHKHSQCKEEEKTDRRSTKLDRRRSTNTNTPHHSHALQHLVYILNKINTATGIQKLKFYCIKSCKILVAAVLAIV